MDEESIKSPMSLWYEISTEYFRHKNLLKEAYIEDNFVITHLLISPDLYTKLMLSPEIQTYAMFGNPQILFDGVEILISPLIEKWKWSIDLK